MEHRSPAAGHSASAGAPPSFGHHAYQADLPPKGATVRTRKPSAPWRTPYIRRTQMYLLRCQLPHQPKSKVTCMKPHTGNFQLTNATSLCDRREALALPEVSCLLLNVCFKLLDPPPPSPLPSRQISTCPPSLAQVSPTSHKTCFSCPEPKQLWDPAQVGCEDRRGPGPVTKTSMTSVSSCAEWGINLEGMSCSSP